MSVHLTRDLETLHQHIMSMCAMVEEVVHKAVDGPGQPGRRIVSQELVDRDDEIDRWDVQIEEECLKILALHQPVANDLRRVTTVLKIAGNWSAWPTWRSTSPTGRWAWRDGPEIVVPEKLNHMAHVALDMLRLRSMRSSPRTAAWPAASAARTTSSMPSIAKSSTNCSNDEAVPRWSSRPAAFFGRRGTSSAVADHATNIAEDVVYLVEGEIVRHGPECWETMTRSPAPSGLRVQADWSLQSH